MEVERATFVTGYGEALERVRRAAQRPPEETFKPLFEALGWAFSIDDYWLKTNRLELREPMIFAVRFARNRIVQGWADILDTRDEVAAGINVTLASGGRPGGAHASGHLVRHWIWRDFDQLRRADPDKRQGEKNYRCLLSGKLVQPTLDDLDAIFTTL